MVITRDRRSDGHFSEEYEAHCQLSWLPWKLDYGKLLHKFGVQQGRLSNNILKSQELMMEISYYPKAM